MKDKERKKTEPAKMDKVDYDEDTQNLQKLLESKFDELFGTIDSNDD